MKWRLIVIGVVILLLSAGGITFVTFRTVQQKADKAQTAVDRQDSDNRRTDYRKISADWNYGQLNMMAPKAWRIAEQGPTSLLFRFAGDWRKIDLLKSAFTIHEAAAWADPAKTDFANEQGKIAEALNSIYDNRSLNGIDAAQLRLPIMAARFILASSFSYIESQDERWRGYYYITKYTTQDAESFKPFIDVVLINKESPQPLLIIGKVDLETQRRHAIDAELERNNRSYTDAIWAQVEIANNEFTTSFSPDVAEQIGEFERVIRSIEFVAGNRRGDSTSDALITYYGRKDFYSGGQSINYEVCEVVAAERDEELVSLNIHRFLCSVPGISHAGGRRYFYRTFYENGGAYHGSVGSDYELNVRVPPQTVVDEQINPDEYEAWFAFACYYEIGVGRINLCNVASQTYRGKTVARNFQDFSKEIGRGTSKKIGGFDAIVHTSEEGIAGPEKEIFIFLGDGTYLHLIHVFNFIEDSLTITNVSAASGISPQ